VKGCGATAMAFVDVTLKETDDAGLNQGLLELA
jgi:hypothetical protein